MEKKINNKKLTNFDNLSKIIDADLLNETNVGSLTNQQTIDELAKKIKNVELLEFNNIEIVSGDKQNPNAKLLIYIFGDKSIKTSINFFGDKPFTIYGMLRPDYSYVYIITPSSQLYVNNKRNYFKAGKGKPSLIDKHSSLNKMGRKEKKETDQFLSYIYHNEQ